MLQFYTQIVKLVGDDGIEPPQADSKSAALPLCKSPVKLERVVRIELTLPVWKTGALPLSYTRKKMAERQSFQFLNSIYIYEIIN